jgi:hypothetical protein
MVEPLAINVVSPAHLDAPLAQRPFQRSVFVTVVGSIFAALAGIGTLIGLLQNAMIWTMAPMRNLQGDWLPLLIFPALLLLNALGLTCSIGLLLRRNWARRGMIVLLALGITWMVVGPVLQWIALSNVPARDGFGSLVLMIKIVSLVIAAVVGVTFGWIIRKLSSQPIKAEFVAAQSA